MSTIELRPQPGPQEMALASGADIVVYGGAAGGGKTWTLLIEPLRHVSNPDFSAVIFRRTSPQIRNPGGLWDESTTIYPLLDAEPRRTVLEWTFPSGALVKFAYMQYEDDKHDWQGAQIPLLMWDELTHFSETQFFYMLSRNRSTCGVRPYVRATCNPDADSWVADLIDWWIADDGYADLDRAGVVRWFVRVNDTLEWSDTRAELIGRFMGQVQAEFLQPKSLTFIPSSVYDNPALMDLDPGYVANLLALPYVERQRLLGDRRRGGNWAIRAEGGNVFNRDWFAVVDEAPKGGVECRFFDFAATRKELAKDDPDYTAAVKIRKANGAYYVVDVKAAQMGPAETDKFFHRIVEQDVREAKANATRYMVRWEIEPGSAAKREAVRMVKALAGLDARGVRSTGDKIDRAKPFAVQAEHGNVSLVRAPWNDAYLRELHNQPDAPHDDQMDASSGAFGALHRERRLRPA
jgi:predicted phage terminase large subunit-like protein